MMMIGRVQSIPNGDLNRRLDYEMPPPQAIRLMDRRFGQWPFCFRAERVLRNHDDGTTLRFTSRVRCYNGGVAGNLSRDNLSRSPPRALARV